MKVPKARKLPSGKWFIQLRLDGKSVSITEDTERDCVRQAALVKAEFLNGKKTEEKPDITLTKAIDKYIASKSAVLSPSTIRGYRAIQKNYFKNVMEKSLYEIDWQREINAEAKNHAPKTIKNSYRFLCSVSRENGVEPKTVVLPQQIKKERPFLSKDELVKFVEAMHGNKSEIAALLALHSLRRSEIVGLDWKNVDLENKTITVSGSKVFGEDGIVYKKTNKNAASARTVPIIMPELYDALNAVENKTGMVVPFHPNIIYNDVNRVCERIGVPKVGVHGLRHTFVTMAYSAGLSELACMRIAGYSDFATMRKIYTHLDNSAMTEATEKLKDFLSQ